MVTLDKAERKELSDITAKGSHSSQKVVNALILLNCDEGAFNERQLTGEVIAGILRISMRKVDRVKRRFVEEGLEAWSCVRPLPSRNGWTWLTSPSTGPALPANPFGPDPRKYPAAMMRR